MTCPNCGRISREGETCEWCRKPLTAAAAPAARAAAPAADKPETAAHRPDGSEDGIAEADHSGAPAKTTWDTGEVAEPTTLVERLEEIGIDRDTLPILLLILIHVAVSVARGGLSLYSLPILLWLVAGAATVRRRAWAPALALALVCTEIAFHLFGVAPRTLEGLPAWQTIDFVMLLARIITGFLIFRLRDQFEEGSDE